MICLRPFRQADVSTLYEIDHVCFATGIAYSKTELRYYLQHPSAFTVIAEDRHRGIVGFCIAQFDKYAGRWIGHIITIDVIPASRRTGVGHMLMAAMDTCFHAKSVNTVELEVAVDNLSAQAFYAHFGFTIIGRIPDYYPGHLDAFVMQKRLKPA